MDLKGAYWDSMVAGSMINTSAVDAALSELRTLIAMMLASNEIYLRAIEIAAAKVAKLNKPS